MGVYNAKMCCHVSCRNIRSGLVVLLACFLWDYQPPLLSWAVVCLLQTSACLLHGQNWLVYIFMCFVFRVHFNTSAFSNSTSYTSSLFCCSCFCSLFCQTLKELQREVFLFMWTVSLGILTCWVYTVDFSVKGHVRSQGMIQQWNYHQALETLHTYDLFLSANRYLQMVQKWQIEIRVQ